MCGGERVYVCECRGLMEVTGICSCKLSPGDGVTEGSELLHVGAGSHSGPGLELSIGAVSYS